MVSRIKPAIDKHKKLYSPSYSRDASLDYPLYVSKRVFIANKIFDVLYLQDAVDNNVPLVHLESLIEDLKYHKENSFMDEFCKEMKKELPKLLKIVTQHKFNIEKDCEDSNLFENRIKSRRRRRRNMLAMSTLRSNQLQLEDDEAVNASSSVDMLQAFDNNPNKEEHLSVVDEHA